MNRALPGPYVTLRAAVDVAGPPAPPAVTSTPRVRPVVKKSRPVHTARRAAPAHRVVKHSARRPVEHHTARRRPATRHVVARKVRHTVQRSYGGRGGMSAVVGFALSQVGDRYVHGASGPSSWDCSGLTQAAFARAGIRLPHSSGAQRGMSRPVSRSQARAGDLVVGPGHVGVYLGGGMMVDAGNPRVGVVRRHLYPGLSIRRF